MLGGTGYVGGEVCRLLAKHGVKVAFTWNRAQERAEKLSAELSATALRWECLAGDGKTLIEDAAYALGGFDALVQCIGTAGDAAIYREPLDDLDKFLAVDAHGFTEMMAVTAAGTFSTCQAAAAVMRHNGGGHIVLVGSMDGVKPVPAPVHYAAAKGAVSAMTAAMSKALGGAGILVNCLAPGILDGGIGRLLSDKLRDDYIRHCALKRLGTAREVAEWAAWLVLANTYVTGQTILLDGGL